MVKYPEERKQAILRKMAPPYSMTVAGLSAEEGISDVTLYNWRKQARAQGAILPSNAASHVPFRGTAQTLMARLRNWS